ncbi:Stf0 sulfotransferase [Methyloligella halotolerans]|uniref:Stf0 sulfotransferase n=1 Tax=Methyloligella halotolerans TaxID=1177755 RepID=A0A1E2RZQ0_9HYPH|nr:Stf0 family sulfotransferase [Methyloligella halotolerans]ODA67539.1 Stf0 sulfotransferase [Methyloligella halotolerans]
MTAHDREWNRWFDASNIDPLRFTYEDLSAAPIVSLGLLLARLGLDGRAADQVEPKVAKLADSINQSWVERFVSAEKDGAV